MSAMERKQIGTCEGRPVERVTLRNGQITAVILSFGGVLQILKVRDRGGACRDVVLGFADWASYVNQNFFIGAVIGRCANRISGASFDLHGETSHLEANEGKNHLHGGSRGFWNVPFQVAAVGEEFVTLRYLSPDGEGGYPGRLDASVTFSISGGALTIAFAASSDRDTVVNLTHHTYFNLEKDHAGTVNGEKLTLFADRFTEIDDACSSTGRILPVEGTPFDCRAGALIGERISAQDSQMKKGSGFNHNFVLSKPQDVFGPVAEVVSSDGLLAMRMESDQPGVQVYGGNYLDGTLTGKYGERYQQFSGLCLETQCYPDAIHFPQFPSPVLKAGARYQRKTTFAFF